MAVSPLAVISQKGEMIMAATIASVGCLLGFYGPNSSTKTKGAQWYASDYIYCNHWRPGLKDSRGVAVEAIGNRPTTWLEWLWSAYNFKVCVAGVMLLLWWVFA